MRKAIMGVGSFLIIVGLIQLILSVTLVGGVKDQFKDIDVVMEDTTGTLTEVADVLDDTARYLGDLDVTLADVEEPVGDITDAVTSAQDITLEWLERMVVEVTADSLYPIAEMMEDAGLDASGIRDEADRLRQEGLVWRVTEEDATEPFTLVLENLELVSDTISGAREFLTTAQTDISGIGDGVRTVSEDIEAVDISGIANGVIGWLQTYMIISSILFMAVGAGLFLVGIRRTED